MQVKQIRPDYYQIDDDGPAWVNRWWTAKQLGNQGWYITNNRSTVIKETSVLGRKIIKAIEAYRSEQEAVAL